MAKVLRIINRFNLGGPTYNAAYLTKYLSPEFQTLLIGGDAEANEGSSSFILKEIGVKPLLIPEMHRAISYKDDIAAYFKIKNIISRFKPDIVHTHASKAGALGRMAAHSLGVPIIVHTFHGHVFHSYFSRPKTLIYKQIERRLAHFSTRIIAISPLQKYELSQVHSICHEDKIEVIPLGFDLNKFNENAFIKRSEFRTRYHLNDDEIAIGIVGRLVPIKNHEMFLRGFARVSESTSLKLRAFIVGDGELMSHLQSYSESLGLSIGVGESSLAQVTFTSWEKQVDFVNAGLDIVCLTSLNEGTPVSIIEAQASGKPVICSRVGGVENVVQDSVSGFLFERDDEVTFVKLLIRLVENADLRHQFGKAGWDIVAQRYHYTRLVNDTAQLYNTLLEEVGVNKSRFIEKV
jgi:glycosyltransferase involved in cell wall biosynthesis